MPMAQRTASTVLANQDAIARGLYNAAAMFGDLWVNEGLAQRFERTKGAFLIVTHQTAVTYDISRENCCQPPFDPRFGHKSCPAAL